MGAPPQKKKKKKYHNSAKTTLFLPCQMHRHISPSPRKSAGKTHFSILLCPKETKQLKRCPPVLSPRGDSQDPSLPSIRDTWSCGVFPTPYCGYFPSWLLHLSSSQPWNWGTRGGWGEALGGSTHHHLPPRRGTKPVGTAAGDLLG